MMEKIRWSTTNLIFPLKIRRGALLPAGLTTFYSISSVWIFILPNDPAISLTFTQQIPSLLKGFRFYVKCHTLPEDTSKIKI